MGNIVARSKYIRLAGIAAPSPFTCTIHEKDRLLARGDVKAYRPKDVFALLGVSR